MRCGRYKTKIKNSVPIIVNKIMKKLIFISLHILFMLCSCTAQNPNSATMAEDKELIKTYVNALDSFAMAMPIIGGDTESYWAADTVHCMAKDILAGNYDYQKSMTKIYQIQDYIAYGMTYFSAIVSVYREPELANFALSMIQTSDSLYSVIENEDYQKLSSIMEYGCLSLFNMQLFAHFQNSLNKANNEKPIFNEDAFGASLQSLEIMTALNEKFTYTDNDLKKISATLENADFFKAIFPLTQRFATSEEEFNIHLNLILEAARFFDEYANPIRRAYRAGEEVKPMSDEQYKDYFKKATMYKVAILRMTTDEIKKMKRID